MSETPTDADFVGDDEMLYRAVRNNSQNVVVDAAGAVRLSSQAFSDRRMRPSVDRARLRNHESALTRFDVTDGVVRLIAAQVRGLSVSVNDANGNPIPDQVHVADVEPVPLPENPAHAEIFGRPEFDNKAAFRRLCDLLARLAEWEIKPPPA